MIGWASLRGWEEGAIVGAIGGLFLDVMSAAPFGVNIFRLAVLGIVAGLVIGLIESLTAAYLGGKVRDIVPYVTVLVILLFMPRGIVNLAMKKGWLPPGRSLFRQLAREDRAKSAPAAAPVVRDDVKRAEA